MLVLLFVVIVVKKLVTDYMVTLRMLFGIGNGDVEMLVPNIILVNSIKTGFKRYMTLLRNGLSKRDTSYLPSRTFMGLFGQTCLTGYPMFLFIMKYVQDALGIDITERLIIILWWWICGCFVLAVKIFIQVLLKLTRVKNLLEQDLWIWLTPSVLSPLK